MIFNSVKYYVVCFFNVLFLLSIKSKEKSKYYFFYLEKIKYFDFFIQQKIYNKSWNSRKTNNLNFESKLFSAKCKKKKNIKRWF